MNKFKYNYLCLSYYYDYPLLHEFGEGGTRVEVFARNAAEAHIKAEDVLPTLEGSEKWAIKLISVFEVDKDGDN